MLPLPYRLASLVANARAAISNISKLVPLALGRSVVPPVLKP